MTERTEIMIMLLLLLLLIPGMVAHAFNPSTGRKRQADL